MEERIVVVTGATGKQGGAVLRHLASAGGFRLRAMTRNPLSDGAKALSDLGVEIVKGDFDDVTALTNALAGAWGVFSVQNTWEAGVKKEEEQGKRVASVARERGVQHFVYTSVGSAHESTGIPHFENKSRIEETVRSAGFPSYTILRPVFFMENLVSPWFFAGDKLLSTLRPTTKLQMIASDDVGRFAAAAFADHRKWNGAEVDIAGDAATMPEAAEALSEGLGRTITYESLPTDAVKKHGDDFVTMLEWFDRKGYSADVAKLEARWGVRPTPLREWTATLKK